MEDHSQYQMGNLTRALSVFKDLSRILRERNIKVRPADVKLAVAKLFGYNRWQELEAGVGASKSLGPEDHELEPVLLEKRRSAQVGAVMALGVEEDDAQQILTRLRPTGRSGRTPKATMFQRYSTIADYHPSRFFDAWGEMFEPNGRFEEEYFDIGTYLGEWAKDRPMLAHDKEVCFRDHDLDVDYIFDVCEKVGFVIDAVGVREAVASKSVSTDTVSSIPDPYRNVTYVHLGQNTYPTPYKDVGIEGAYVRYYYSEDNPVPDLVEVRLVCSPIFGTDNDQDEDSALYRDDLLHLRDLLRGPLVELDPTKADFLNTAIRSFQRAAVRQEKYGGILAEWTEHIHAPTAAALHAVKIAVHKEVAIVDALPKWISAQELAKFERATTDKKLLSTAATTSCRYPLVRFLGRMPPPEAVTSEHTIRYDDTRIPVDAELLNAMAFDMQGFGPRCSLKLLERYVELATITNEEGEICRANALALHTLMRAVGEGNGRGCEQNPEVLSYRDRLVGHLNTLIESPSEEADRFMILGWLAARILSNDVLAMKAVTRIEKSWMGRQAGSHVFDKYLGPLQYHLDVLQEQIDAGIFGYPMHYFMNIPWERTHLAVFRPSWDQWFVQSMARELSEEEIADLKRKGVPGW